MEPRPPPQVERASLPAPSLRVVIPPAPLRQETVSSGAFAAAWHALVGSWTVGVVRTGRPFPTVALSAPFWAAGAQLASSSLLPSVEARCARSASAALLFAQSHTHVSQSRDESSQYRASALQPPPAALSPQSTELFLDAGSGRFRLSFAVAPSHLRWTRKLIEGRLEDIECAPPQAPSSLSAHCGQRLASLMSPPARLNLCALARAELETGRQMAPS